MSRAIRWNAAPSRRLLQVFDRNNVASGCWQAWAAARAHQALAKLPGGHIIIVDEYTAKLPHLGHAYRAVVGRIDTPDPTLVHA